MRWKLLIATSVGGLLGVVTVAPAVAGGELQPSGESAVWSLLAASLAWLMPAGLTLIAAAGVPPERAWHTALAGVAGAALAVVAFFAVGFGLAFGGLGLVHSQVAGFDGLVWEWSGLSSSWGTNWGMAGLSGWALQGAAATPAAYGLLFTQLPWVAMAALVPVLALRGRTPAPVTLLVGVLVGGLLYPLATNWVWGGGWLANLGANLGLGHGFVDFAGAGTVHLVGGAVALAGLLVMVARQPRRLSPAESDGGVPLPPVHLPLLASVGAILVLAGSLGWGWANPLLDPAGLMPMRGAVNAVLAATGGALLPLAYIWLATGKADSSMAAKGLAGGAVAGAAMGPFVSPVWALLVGAVVGLLVPLLTYLFVELLRVADDTGVVPIHLLGATLGLAAIGLVADGMVGVGWNGIGQTSILEVPGQGVTGLLATPGLQPDWPGQFQAQVVGMAALFLVPFLVATVLLAPVAVVVRGLGRQRPDVQQTQGQTRLEQEAPSLLMVAGETVEVESGPPAAG